MPVRVRNLLDLVGDERILRIQLGRTPVQAVLITILNFLSDSKFSDKQLELGYDEIYHNYLLITITNSKKLDVLQHILGNAGQNTTPTSILKLEKVQRIALQYPTPPDDFIEVYDIPLIPDKPMTLNRLISTASNVDENFYSYDAAENNMCQTFVGNIIEINGLTHNILDQATLTALKQQDAKALITTLGSRASIVKTATDFGVRLDELVYDHKIKCKKLPPKTFSLLGNTYITGSKTTDVLYNAVRRLEQNGKKKNHNNTIIIIFIFSTFETLLVVTGMIISLDILRKKILIFIYAIYFLSL
jgi:hypothetical protein